jgi:hypothetical protein
MEVTLHGSRFFITLPVPLNYQLFPPGIYKVAQSLLLASLAHIAPWTGQFSALPHAACV